MFAVHACEGANVVASFAARRQGNITAKLEYFAFLFTKRQRPPDQSQLHRAGVVALEQLAPEFCWLRAGETFLQLSQQSLAQGVIDWPAIVRIDESEVPQLGALVKI